MRASKANGSLEPGNIAVATPFLTYPPWHESSYLRIRSTIGTTPARDFQRAAGMGAYLIESGGVGDDIDTDNILFDPTRAGNTLLCDGPCDLVAGSNVIDAMQFEGLGSAVALPGPVTFTPGPLTGITSANDTTHSFVKQTDVGTFPNFLASDWMVGPKTK